MKKIINRLDMMLIDDILSNKWSSNRFTFVFTVIISNVTFWLLIFYLSIVLQKFPEIPDAIIYIYGMANGFAFGGKVVQKYSEVKQIISNNGVTIEKVKNGKIPNDSEESPESTSPEPLD